VFIGETGARLMCAWDTSADTVDCLLADLKWALSASSVDRALT
jgi:hypothetical protein